MCDPLSIQLAMLAISTVSTVGAHNEGVATAKAQQDSIVQSAEMNNIQTAQVYDQQNQAAMEQSSQRHQEWLRDLGRLRAVGAESGLTGSTEQRIQNEATTQAETDLATIEANRFKENLSAASTGVAQNRQANAAMKSVRKPSLIGSGLQIAGAVASGYAQYKKETT